MYHLYCALLRVAPFLGVSIKRSDNFCMWANGSRRPQSKCDWGRLQGANMIICKEVAQWLNWLMQMFAWVCRASARYRFHCAILHRWGNPICTISLLFSRWGLYNCANVFKQRNKSFVPRNLRSRGKTSEMLCAVMTSVMMNWCIFFFIRAKISRNSWIEDAQRLMSCYALGKRWFVACVSFALALTKQCNSSRSRRGFAFRKV